MNNINKRYLGNSLQLTKLRRVMCLDGIEQGLTLIEVNNGFIEFDLYVDKCLDIGKLAYKDKNISFISKNGFNNHSNDFANSFPGGMLYTCGLDSIGERKGFTLHGKIHNTPCKLKMIEETDETIIIEGDMYFNELYGRSYKLSRTIITEKFSNEITITDKLLNLGFKEEDYCLLYHINFGYPFLNENTFINCNVNKTISRNQRAQEYGEECFLMQKPEDDSPELVYFHTLNNNIVDIISPDCKLKVSVIIDTKSLPYLIEWKSMQSSDYALGIEPSTTLLDDYFQYKKILPNEVKAFTIKLIFEEI